MPQYGHPLEVEGGVDDVEAPIALLALVSVAGLAALAAAAAAACATGEVASATPAGGVCTDTLGVGDICSTLVFPSMGRSSTIGAGGERVDSGSDSAT